jgi:hypothetical protein
MAMQQQGEPALPGYCSRTKETHNRCAPQTNARRRVCGGRACGGRCGSREVRGWGRTSLRSYMMRCVLTSTVGKYRELGSKAAKAGSKGRPARLLPRLYRGSKPPWGGPPRSPRDTSESSKDVSESFMGLPKTFWSILIVMRTIFNMRYRRLRTRGCAILTRAGKRIPRR